MAIGEAGGLALAAVSFVMRNERKEDVSMVMGSMAGVCILGLL